MRLRKVGVLVDLYITEVAPDPCLRPSKFLALAMVLPDAARDSYDELYRAIDMYLEVWHISQKNFIQVLYLLVATT
jgi:hypothetical protein